MAHVRKQIRDRVKATLTSGVSLVSNRVYASRVYALSASKLPAVTIYTGSEDSNLRTMGQKTLSRNLSLTVDCYVRVTDTFDDDVDAIAVQVEEAIAADYTINGLAKDAELVSTEIDFDGDSEQPIGVARMTYMIRYVTTIGDVELAK